MQNLHASASDPGTSDSSTNIPSGQDDGQEETDSIINVEDTVSEQSSDSDVEVTSQRRVMDSNAASDSDTVEWRSDYEPASEDEVTVQMGHSDVVQVSSTSMKPIGKSSKFEGSR